MEFCLNANNNANGVYPRFDLTFTNPTGAAVAQPIAIPATANAASAKIKRLCSKCRRAAA